MVRTVIHAGLQVVKTFGTLPPGSGIRDGVVDCDEISQAHAFTRSRSDDAVKLAEQYLIVKQLRQCKPSR